MRVPDFFVVGAPKCGTTALYSYLRDHPRIFMPERKEIHYFCDDLNFPKRSAIRDWTEYLDLFIGATSDMRIGETSASYLYSDVAIHNIMNANSNAKLIAILRNPVDMAYSFHAQLLSNLNEDTNDFSKAWSLQESRQNGVNIPKYCTEPKFLQYKSVCCFSSQITRLMQSAGGRDNVLIVIFENFAREPRIVYERILDFLDLPSDGRTSFPKVNANMAYRSALLNRLVRRPPGPVDALYSTMKRGANALGLRPRRLLERINAQRTPRAKLDADFRRHLEAEFAPDIERLEAILGCKLDAWRSHDGSSH